MRLHGPQRFLVHCLSLRKDEDSPPEQVRQHLQEVGYVEDDPVTEPGEFSLRGGILDVFPPQMTNPVRLEFFGDRLESLRTFDVETQRSIQGIDSVQIVPMREICLSRDTLIRWANEVPNHWSKPFQAHLEEEVALAGQGELFPAHEFLLPMTDPLDHSIFDYLAGARLMVCDREVIEATLANTMPNSTSATSIAWMP